MLLSFLRQDPIQLGLDFFLSSFFSELRPLPASSLLCLERIWINSRALLPRLTP